MASDEWDGDTEPQGGSDSDLAVLNRARNQYLYGDSINSIVGWTLSNAWRAVPKKTALQGKRNGIETNSCSGEIANAR